MGSRKVERGGLAKLNPFVWLSQPFFGTKVRETQGLARLHVCYLEMPENILTVSMAFVRTHLAPLQRTVSLYTIMCRGS